MPTEKRKERWSWGDFQRGPIGLPQSVESAWLAMHPEQEHFALQGCWTVHEMLATSSSEHQPTVLAVRDYSAENDQLKLQVECLETLLAQERQFSTYQRNQNDKLQNRLQTLEKQYQELVSTLRLKERSKPAVRQRFARLSTIWKAETGHVSNVTTKCTHPAYQKIIGMGRKVVPLILLDLKLSKTDWFWALTAITGENPISQEIAGNINKMTEAWLRWGRTQGYDI